MVQQYFDVVWNGIVVGGGGAELTHNVEHDRTKFRFIRLKSS